MFRLRLQSTGVTKDEQDCWNGDSKLPVDVNVCPGCTPPLTPCVLGNTSSPRKDEWLWFPLAYKLYAYNEWVIRGETVDEKIG